MSHSTAHQRSFREPVEAVQGVRSLDRAEGILVGLRGCTPIAAFGELVDAARQHAVPVFTLASALVAMACDQSTPSSHGTAASAARAEWGDLIGRARTRTTRSQSIGGLATSALN